MEENQIVYNSQLAIKTYFQRTGLSPGEIFILNYITGISKNIKMLDIGIGCGRTFEGFSKKVSEYTGIDYSDAMVKACKQKFENAKDSFSVSDARNLCQWADGIFDFILFSFNGIDCVNQEGRIKVFNEIKRVGKNQSFFAFSSHNLYSISKLFRFKIPKNPFNYLPEYKRYRFTIKSNQSLNTLFEKGIAEIKDGDINKETSYCYVKPDFQINQLESLGFEMVGVYSDQKNMEYPMTTDWKSITEPWLYYLCQIIK
ncbi:MAG: class I SAM-dependent methyltransferase [Bacteroidota bacterium]